MRKLNVLIAGSTGYIGIQLVKLLVNHKNIKIKYLCGSSSVGKNIEYFDISLKNKKLPLPGSWPLDSMPGAQMSYFADALFCCFKLRMSSYVCGSV